MKQLIYILAVTVLLFGACTRAGKTENTQAKADVDTIHANNNHDTEMVPGMAEHMDGTQMTVQESQATSMVIDAYLEIGNALGIDNDKEAAKAGKELVTAFDKFDKSSVPDENRSELGEIIADARENADHISESQGNIEHQREHFEMLSTDIKDLIAIAGADRTLYQIYCPMYNNNEGGSWLSASDVIKNPFYGNKMPTCGEVKSEILPM